MFADKLKKLRSSKSITQAELAETINVSRSLVAKWEQGKAIPTEECLEKIGEFFSENPNSLISNHELRDNNRKVKKDYKHIIIALSVVIAVTITTITASLETLSTDSTYKEETKNDYVVESVSNTIYGDYTDIKFENTDIEYNSIDYYYEYTPPYFMINGKEREFNHSVFEIKKGDTLNLDITWTITSNGYKQIKSKEYFINSINVVNINYTKQLTGFYVDFSNFANEPDIYKGRNFSDVLSIFDMNNLSFNPASSFFFNISDETKEENAFNYNYSSSPTIEITQDEKNVDFAINVDLNMDFSKWIYRYNDEIDPDFDYIFLHYWFLYSDGTYSPSCIDNYHENFSTGITSMRKDTIVNGVINSIGQIQTKYLVAMDESSNDQSYSDLSLEFSISNKLSTDNYKIIQFDKNGSTISTQDVSSITDLDELTISDDISYAVVKEYNDGKLLKRNFVDTGEYFEFEFCSEYGIYTKANQRSLKF